MSITTIPPIFYQFAFNADPNQAAVPPYWTDQSWRVQFPWTTSRGRQYELDAVETGEWRPTLANPDGALDPSNTASPYYPNVIPYRQTRVQCIPGANLLTPDQATAGEATGYPAGIPVPRQMLVSNDFGYTVTLAASGTAYQGNQVYQATLPASSTQFTTILLVKPVAVTPGATYTFSAQILIASGTSTPTDAAVLWFDHNGATISTAAGSSVTPVPGSPTWNTVSVSGAAPSGAYTAALKIQIASGGSTSAQTIWQADGLQWEQSATPTAFQVPFTPSPNLLPRAIATGTASINTATDSPANWFYPAAGSVAQATGLTAAPTGSSTAVAWTSPAGTTASSPLHAGAAPSGASATGPVADCVQANPPFPASFSVYLMRAASADATVIVTPAIAWFSSAGLLLSTTTGTGTIVQVGSWVRVSATAGFAPAGAAWGRAQIYISSPASTTATNVIYATGWQWEQAGGARTWYDPGNVYEIFTGFVERWPQTWSEQDGTYGTSDIVGLDSLAALAQYTLPAPFIAELLALGPNFVYPLNDAAGSSGCVDAAAKRLPAPVENAPFGSGTLTFGNSVASANATGAFVGTPGPVATFVNDATQNPPTQVQRPETFISLHKTTTTPGPPAAGAWTRIIAFRASTAPGTNKAYTLWDAEPPSWSTNASLCSFAINNLGQAIIQWSDFAGTGAWAYTGATNLCDGNWHLLGIGNDPAAAGTVVWVDGAVVSTAVGATGSPSGIATDVLGCAVSAGRQWYDGGHIGDLAFAAEFPLLLSSAQMTNLYNSWRSASTGDSSDARVGRVLKWISWSGPMAIDTGQTVSMGPATDLSGATALDAANNVALTENGAWYAAANGALTFKARTARYGQTTPAFVFGENTAASEWPFENPFQFEDDTSHIASNVQVTQYNASTYTAIDATSTRQYFPRVYQRTVNASAASECQDAANYLLGRYKGPRMRVSALRLHPSAVPGLFLVCLGLELGARIRVNRRSNGAPQITFDGFVEKIDWDWDPHGEVFVTLQCSPADLSSYWQLAALHTTLHAQAASGQNTASINALPDAHVNQLSQSLPSGYQLTFDPGTPLAETMTIAPGGIPATTIGYQNATLTFTSNFTFTHASGAVVCEPLPANVTDPTAYDAASVLGAASCQLAAAASAGASTITVGPLGDGATNALGSDWAAGDLLSISPGTPAWEGYNLLRPNQSTAGEGVFPLAAGSSGAALGITADAGTPTVAASATAFQGANVWQVSVAGGVSTPTGLLYVLKVPAAAGLPFTNSAYVRSVTSGANPTVAIYVKYYDINGNALAQTTSGTTTLTGASGAAWTRISATRTAPAGTAWVQLGILLQGTAPASAWTFQADGLQVEQAGSASVYCTTPQVLSVAASVPGYSSVVVTLNAPLVNSHGQGDTVCDPLPPGVTNPAAVAATCRLAY